MFWRAHDGTTAAQKTSELNYAPLESGEFAREQECRKSSQHLSLTKLNYEPCDDNQKSSRKQQIKG